MTPAPAPVVFDPIFKAKPWGGRKLSELFGKALPPNQPIGESWELVSLPGEESRSRSGPGAGTALGELVAAWGEALCGPGHLVAGRFPWLIKFLDARENLSVQVHPKPPDSATAKWIPGVKHEAWYVVYSKPGAELYLGLREGVTPADVAKAANTPNLPDLLCSWVAKPGQCFYLPSGVPHALGAGIVVAEIQTPSDITYRLYDWDRRGIDGVPRPLHVTEALANLRDVSPQEILCPTSPAARVGDLSTCHITTCESFRLELHRVPAATRQRISPGMRAWVVLVGQAVVRHSAGELILGPGDVALLPALVPQPVLETAGACEFLQVTLPGTH